MRISCFTWAILTRAYSFFYASPVFPISEPDGIRLITSDVSDFIQKVPAPTVSIFRPGSTSPSAILFDAWENFNKRSPKADENIRSIRTELAKAVEFDLIILDVMLPGLDGWQVLTGLRRAGKTTQVLFLTARDAVHELVGRLRGVTPEFPYQLAAGRDCYERGDDIVVGDVGELGAFLGEAFGEVAEGFAG